MLFQFHKEQNSKKPGSVKAVYVVSGMTTAVTRGVSTQGSQAPDGDAYMRSSPPLSSSMPQPDDDEEPLAVRSITICREEDLDGPRPVPTPTPVAAGRGSLGSTAAAPAKEEKSSQRKISTQEEISSKARSLQLGSQEKKATAKPPRLKKEASDIFKSFAKPRGKVSRENTESSAAPSPVTHEEPNDAQEVHDVQTDDPMNGASESEQEEDFMIKNENAAQPGHPNRQEREEQLRNLMNDDDDAQAEDPMEASDTDAPIQIQESSTTALPEKNIGEEAVVSAGTTGGRRRGRRKVMKKKMLKDEEGYLVTKEEPAWESFSEDEPLPKETTTQASTVSSAAKGKRMSGKPGQGNIMSFFGKK
ncbi:MAG: hypothetical protein Q9220_005396 [cf. Caloplaca sp. 1 TL-2023]